MIFVQTILSLFANSMDPPCPTSTCNFNAMLTFGMVRSRVSTRVLVYTCTSILLVLTIRSNTMSSTARTGTHTRTKALSLYEGTTNTFPHRRRHPHDIPSDGFSGCLVVKDDNDRLSEWMAYHWLTLPLKYLIVAVDPTGTSSPQDILTVWNSTLPGMNMGMEILLWNDADYGHWIDEELDTLHKHRARQKRFLAECQKFHKDKGRTWIAVIDPDEYITYNPISDSDRDPERKSDVDVFDIILENPIRKNHTTFDCRVEMQDARRNMTQENVFDRLTIFDYISINTKKKNRGKVNRAI